MSPAPRHLVPSLHSPQKKLPPTPHDKGKGKYSDPVQGLIAENDGRFGLQTLVYVGESGGQLAGWYLEFLGVRVAAPLAWVDTRPETRREVQSALLWCWHRDWAIHNGWRIAMAHATTKLDLLLPIKLGCDHEATRKRAEFERDVLNHVPAREHRIGAAYDLIRSKDVPVAVFAEWLSEYQRLAAEQGCVLVSKTEEARYAMTGKYTNNNQEKAAA